MKMNNKKTILISGGDGELARAILKHNKKFKILAPKKQDLNILCLKQLSEYLEDNKPDIFLHAAAFTRPMLYHQKYPQKSIETNIIGTSNIVMECIKHKIKLVYISTDYVYPGLKGNYKEEDALNPYVGNRDGINKYAWSKLGGECAVRIYENSLIIRLCMSKKPFPHNQAPSDVIKSYIYSDKAAEIILKATHLKGILNVGGIRQSIYHFALKDNPEIREISRHDIKDTLIAPDTSMDLTKLKKLIKEN